MGCVCSVGGGGKKVKKCSFPERIGSLGPILEYVAPNDAVSPSTWLSCSLSLSHIPPTFEKSGRDPSRSGGRKLPTSHDDKPVQAGVIGRPCELAESLQQQLWTRPASFPSSAGSRLEECRERPGREAGGRGAPSLHPCSRPGPNPGPGSGASACVRESRRRRRARPGAEPRRGWPLGPGG